jgi:hypothetical protein
VSQMLRTWRRPSPGVGKPGGVEHLMADVQKCARPARQIYGFLKPGLATSGRKALGRSSRSRNHAEERPRC